MARNNDNGREVRTRGWEAVVLLTVLLVAAFVVLWWNQREQHRARPTETGPATTQAGGEVVDRGLVYGGTPRALRGQVVKVLHNTGYVSGYSEERKEPLWVGYRLFRVDNPPTYPRPQKFLVDERTMARVRHEDYSNTGYSRGHMAPNRAIAECYGKEAQLQTFLMSNICPQLQTLNGGPWEAVEDRELEDYARRYGEVWVIDGPVFAERPAKIGPGVDIPRAFYKVIVDDRRGKRNGEGAGTIRMQAFIMPQTAGGRARPGEFLRRVVEVEQESGFDFFWQLEDMLERKLEEAPAGKEMW